MRPSIARTTKTTTVNSRRMLFYGFLGILCIARTIESAPLDIGNDSTRRESTGTLSSGLPTKKGQEEEVGNPSELAWQAWLLVDGHPGSQPSGILDSASLLRRITPKSIFIAPKRTDCPEGYQDDTMSRCVKDVNIDHQAQMGFLVERLKAIYGNVGKPQAAASAASSSSSSSSASIPSGPLHLNIPLLITGPAKPSIEKTESHEPEKLPSTVKPLKIITGELAEPGSVNPHHQDAIVTVYELNEDTREDEDSFFLGNKSTDIFNKNDKSPSSRPDLVPVAEFVDDNDSNVSGIVDYKIPIPVEKIYNRTIDSEETPNAVRENANADDVSPTLVLLLSPTKVPSISMPSTSDLLAHNSSLGQVIIKMENVTGNVTGKEIIRLSVPDSAATIRPVEHEAIVSAEESTTDSRLPIGDLVSGEEKDNNEENERASTETYEDENYEESTEIEDEILKHSEAGMTVTIRDSVKPVTAETPAESNDRETTGSSEISSEVSINGDFVRETTLVDFNVSKTSNSNETSTTIEETSTSALIDDSKALEAAETSLSSSDDLINDKRDDEPIPKIDNENRKNIEKIAEVEKNIEKIGQVEKNIEKIVETEKNIEKMPELVFPAPSIDDLYDKEPKIEASAVEKSEIGETMIAASTNDAGQMISEPPKFDIVPSSKKRGQPFRFEGPASTTKIPSYQNVEGVYDYEPVPRDYPRRPIGLNEDDALPVIRTMDEQRYRPEEDEQSFFGSQQQQQQQQQQDYVRFPSYDRHGRPNYVRFPSEEANSIHSPNDYKDRNRRPYGQYQPPNYSRGPQATKNIPGSEIRQKQSYWWVPPGWRMDRQQQQSQSQQMNPQRSRSGSVDRPRDRAPMLLRFWTRMPLVRDPSLNYQQPTYPTLGANSRSDSRSHNAPSRRVNYYKEMSTQDLSRAFTRKSLPSAIGG